MLSGKYARPTDYRRTENPQAQPADEKFNFKYNDFEPPLPNPLPQGARGCSTSIVTINK
jgi:hypothetical protein